MSTLMLIVFSICVAFTIAHRSEHADRLAPVQSRSLHLQSQEVHDSSDHLSLPGLQVASQASPEGNGHADQPSESHHALLNRTRGDRPMAVGQWPVAVGFSSNGGHPTSNWSMANIMSGHAPSQRGKRDPFEHYYGPDGTRRGGKYLRDILAAPTGEHWGWHWLTAIGGGTGASIGGTGSSVVDRDLLRRMHYQDKAVMLLVLVVYLVALLFSASLTYRQSTNNYPVTYYADPRFHNLVMEGHDLDVFLENFNQAPKNISLKVAGFVPVPDDVGGSVRWRGENFQVAFTFSLDLSPWVVRESTTTSETPIQQMRSLQDGVLPEDRSSLQYYLNSEPNDLAYIEIEKKVVWPGWEELATNIKHQIRQSGFTGVISVDRVESDELQVYKNRPWANFMHARATRVLCALSIVGWVIYVPYMWWRCKKTPMGSHYRVDVSISEYWHLIADKLTADGFQDNPTPPADANVRGSATVLARAVEAGEQATGGSLMNSRHH